jgi:hypothetical protein
MEGRGERWAAGVGCSVEWWGSHEQFLSSGFSGDVSVNGVSLDVGLKILYRMIQWLDEGAFGYYS